MSLICRDERRRHAVRKAKHLNGLDYLEVGPEQLSLTVFFLGKAPLDLKPENVVIRGCKRGAREVRVRGELHLCVLEDKERDDCLQIAVDRPGDFSPYTLCLVEIVDGRPTGKPFPGFDPRYACLEFSFKVDCPSDLDCKDERACPPEPRREPEINYLAKDYASFRQLILDRLALTMPDWRERHVPDLGIALVEVLAYTGDYLSYFQDAVATEAYLNTARRRISVRRHARLVDYPMHEGCNARTWVCVETDDDLTLPLRDVYFVTAVAPGDPPVALPAGKPLGPDDLRDVSRERYEVFEPVPGADAPPDRIELRRAHNEIRFHTWGDGECCLPRGTVRATLRDEWLTAKPKPHPVPKNPPHDDAQDVAQDDCEPPPPEPVPRRRLDLRKGDLLLFEELLGPKTGDPADADPSHRHVVRLTHVEPGVDDLYRQPVVEIEWAREDALPFPLCLSAVGGPECKLLEPVSVARGNVLLADHGETVEEELGTVPAGEPEAHCEEEGRLSELPQTAGRFNPALRRAPLTFRQPLPEHAGRLPAARLPAQDPRQALPQVSLTADLAPFEETEWSVRRDLLAGGPDDPHFVAEVDDDGHAHLRFGDGRQGEAPPAGTAFHARYRAGNGPSGNVGAEALRYLGLRRTLLSGVSLTPRNPLPARGGTAPEPLAEVRLLAPHAFRRELRRAVVAGDYARLVEREFPGRVQRAAATLRWTGSWAEVLVAVDPQSGVDDVDRLLQEIRESLHPYRRIGHDVVVKPAVSVPLDVGLRICVQRHFLRGHIAAALLDVLGRRGFFHPDKLTFGQGIALSRLIAAAQAVEGVESVEIETFERLHEGPQGEIESGFLPLGPLEIARLDDDPRFPGNGRLRLTMRGGR
jgi:hypothetical protein